MTPVLMRILSTRPIMFIRVQHPASNEQEIASRLHRVWSDVPAGRYRDIRIDFIRSTPGSRNNILFCRERSCSGENCAEKDWPIRQSSRSDASKDKRSDDQCHRMGGDDQFHTKHKHSMVSLPCRGRSRSRNPNSSRRPDYGA